MDVRDGVPTNGSRSNGLPATRTLRRTGLRVLQNRQAERQLPKSETHGQVVRVSGFNLCCKRNLSIRRARRGQAALLPELDEPRGIRRNRDSAGSDPVSRRVNEV